MRHLWLAVACAALLLATPARAADWVITKVSGQAWIAAEGAGRQSAGLGMTVPDGHTLATGPRSRVRLERGTEYILVGPETVLSPRHSFWSGTTILQPKGRIEVEVEKRDVQHFAVETPLLAAIVKGTRFTVTADRRGSQVQVSRGLVQVSNFGTGESADLGPGLTARVAEREQALQIVGKGPVPEVTQGSVRSPSPALDRTAAALANAPSKDGAAGAGTAGGSSPGGPSRAVDGSVHAAGTAGASLSAPGLGVSVEVSQSGPGGVAAGAGVAGASANVSVGQGSAAPGLSVDVGGIASGVAGAAGGAVGGALGGLAR